jgi:class 3 adenylate cyclase
MILDESRIRTSNMFGTLQAMSKMATTLGLTLGDECQWPFCTLPHFNAWVGELNKALIASEFVTMGVLVNEGQKNLWNGYSAANADKVVQDGLDSQPDFSVPDDTITPYVWKHSGGDESEGTEVADNGPASQYAVSWQSTPILPARINHNDLDTLPFQRSFQSMTQEKQPLLSETVVGDDAQPPRAFVLQPIFDNFDNVDTDIVAYFKADLSWDNFFEDMLPAGTEGLHVVVDNSCDQTLTYELVGTNGIFLGVGDLHESSYDGMVVSAGFKPIDQQKATYAGCVYSMHVYPSAKFERSYDTDKPLFYAIGGVAVILCTTLVFVIHDCFNERRRRKLVSTATRSNEIVHSLFPETVRDRLMLEKQSKPKSKQSLDSKSTFRNRNSVNTSSTVVSRDLSGSSSSTPNGLEMLKGKPIADLFPHATVVFADVVGFTAWSSVREPTQVFTLLETLYNSFDKVARRRAVFKVETIGDCYVAVTGLPEPRDDHAIVMAKFARECMVKMVAIVNDLELVLGPGTSELSMRFGLHSGPVTAGVLRGEKSRFQLFGDTVNTAARIESTGAKNKIHLSQNTADLLIAAGRAKWVKPRENKVTAKGKGQLQTYWLELKTGTTDSNDTSFGNIEDLTESVMSSGVGNIIAKFEKSEKLNQLSEKTKRLADYNVEVLASFLKKMVAMREPGNLLSKMGSEEFRGTAKEKNVGTALDEVCDVIILPREAAQYKQDPGKVVLPPQVIAQLRDYVVMIASMYRENYFHCFEHASHVTMSVTKLLSRVVTSDAIDYNEMSYKNMNGTSKLHEYTFGITSDPLTHFALAFSALIHDVEHPGVSNAQLVKEGNTMAKTYKERSVAEQNSVDVAWNLLMKPAYKDLRRCIFSTSAELDRFRQLVVNAVLATDILDIDLAASRRKRWEKSFSSGRSKDAHSESDINRKATIVIEHLLQASDVAHTMQHWHVYLKWNKHLFQEMHAAFKAGRGEKDPSETWYQGELSFFDNYIIPLAKKLKECAVFGVSGEEYLNYAIANRRDWELKGQVVVQDYLGEFKRRGRQRRIPTSSMHSSVSSLLSSSNMSIMGASFNSSLRLED